MSSSIQINHMKNGFLIFGFGPTKGLNDITLIAEAQYSINFSRSNRKSKSSL